MNTDQLLDAFRTYMLAAGRGEGTVALRLNYLHQLARIHPDLLAVTRLDLEQFLGVRRATHKAETRASIRSSFRGFYTWALSMELIEKDPSVSLPPIRRPATVPRIADDHAIVIALEGATVEARAMVMLARFGCLRRGEIANLRLADRDRALLRVLGKGEKRRRVPLNPMLAAALDAVERANPGAEFYFPGRVVGRVHLDTVFNVISKATGFNPHALRHAGATAAYRATHNLRAVQELLGHSSIATTQRYLHVDEDELVAVAAATATGFAAAA